ncbi:MAG: hypothetical protein DMF61_04165 [Blastocatellia bacterium AA13]|nr:MAG: hypothetical protein DMF61_04165 [Blastocatellia bacterium AA13]
MERRVFQESPVELIDNGQFLTAEELFSERRTDDPQEMVVRAEVEMYFGRMEKAAELLDAVAPRATDIDVAARFSIASGKLALQRRNYDLAEVHYQTAFHFSRFMHDQFGTSQALLGLAALDHKRGLLAEAAARLVEAREGLKGRSTKKAEVLKGLIISEQAAVSADSGNIEEASSHYGESIRLLKGTERGRYYARALLGLAGLKCATGEFQESLEVFKEANIIFERYDLKQDLAESQLELAGALLHLNRYERAQKLAEESREMRRGSSEDESRALSLLARLALKNNDTNSASATAGEAVALADQTPSSEARALARLSLGQVMIAERDFKKAAEILREAAEWAHPRGANQNGSKGTGSGHTPVNGRLELEATIYLAEAYHYVDTRAGRAELERASHMLSNIEDSWLGDEYNRVAAKYEERIIFTEDNRLVFDGNQLPKWQEAKRTLEGFLLRNALRQTNNSLTRAARKLGVSKVHVHNLKKKHEVGADEIIAEEPEAESESE